MNGYLLVPSVVVGTLIAASGIAAIRTGWLPKWQRRYIQRPRLWGYGQLLMAAYLGLQVTFGVLAEPDARFVGSGVVLVFIAAGLLWAAQRPPRAG
ncbi:hypothetical protein OG905_03370 [Streptomyces sp. NBC_00322]|uniref:hypothetical protein n=1 Tax=Streptomyces sp. NBC_00322 TaxID=2975712 RepID=UPI002E2E4164|nr:hypothetical protein [Streptomyces sp. NBC_00322]